MSKPRVLIVRDGAIGDVIQITPALRGWASAGYRVCVSCHRDVGDAVLANNPHVFHIDNMPHGLRWNERDAHIKRYAERHGIPSARVCDLAGSCESRYLWHSSRPEYHWPEEARRATNAGVNYVRRICCELLGTNETRMELHASRTEQAWCDAFRKRFAGKFIVYLQLHGSSLNKAWPYWPMLVEALHRDPSVIVVTGGSPRATTLEKGIHEHDGVDPARFMPLCHNGGPSWTLRKSILMTRVAHLVIGPETGLVNASMAWGTPTIVLHSHAAPENLIDRDWRNVWSIVPNPKLAPCAPCFKIVGDEDGCYTCDWGPAWLDTAYRCMAAIEPQRVIDQYLEVRRELGREPHRDHREPAAEAPQRGPCVPQVRAHRADAGAQAA